MKILVPLICTVVLCGDSIVCVWEGVHMRMCKEV